MRTTIVSLGGLAVAALALSAPASAQTVSAAQPESIVKTVQDAGYKALLGTDRDGDPKIDSATVGANFHIFFYGCQNHLACRSIEFDAGFSTGIDKGKITVAKMNEWNASKPFATAYLDADGDPHVKWDVPLEGAGMTTAGFASFVEHWSQAVTEFQRFIGRV